MKKLNLRQFSSGHYLGIFILIVIIFALQLAVNFLKSYKTNTTYKPTSEEIAWLALQTKTDSLKDATVLTSNKIYPFNPNFISDFKGYKLGMTNAQIDKLLAFRKTNQYVNSAAEFQKLTGVSNAWLKQYSPYFKFPDWVNNKTNSSGFVNFENNKYDKKPEKITITDINTATQAELEAVYMIGEKTALKILAEKEKFGAFVSMEQLQYIWGISQEALTELNKRFVAKNTIGIKKLKINDLPTKTLQQFPYFNYYIAKNIVTFRSMNGDIKNLEDLTKIKDLPKEKIQIIALYLDF